MPIFMDSTNGNDANPGTHATPVRTLVRAQILAGTASWTTPDVRIQDITPGGGTFPIAGTPTFANMRFGSPLQISSTPFSIVGQLSDELGTLTQTAGSTTVLTVSIPGAVRRTTTASIVAGAPLGQMRISGLGPYGAADNGKMVKVSGAPSTINNNTFIIINGAAAAGSIDVLNAGAVAPDGPPGSITVYDSFDMYTVQITSGTLIGDQRKIRDTTLSGGNMLLEVNVPYAPPGVGVGTTFIVGQAITNIDITSGNLWFHQHAGAEIGMKNIRLLGNVTVFGRLTVWGGNVEFSSRRGSATPALVTFRGAAHVEGGELSGSFWENEGVNNPFSTALGINNAMTFKNAMITLINQAALMNQQFMWRSCTMNIQRAQVGFASPDARRTTFNCLGQSACDFIGNALLPSILDGQLAPSTTTGIINYTGSDNGVMGIQNVVIRNSGGHGISAARGSRLLLAGTGTGDGNAQVGLKLVDGSLAQAPPSGWSLSGSFGEIKVGQNNVRTWANFNATNPVRNEQDLTGDNSRLFCTGQTSVTFVQDGVGRALASASTITLTHRIHHVTGTATINRIDLPGGIVNAAGIGWDPVTIPDGEFEWTDADNIAVAGKAVVNRQITWIWDGAKFYPSYVKK